MPTKKREYDRARKCIKCSEIGLVTDSRVYVDGYLHRIRECPVCRRRWQTVEVPLFDWEEKG